MTYNVAFNSPVYRVAPLSDRFGIELSIKRDDLIPHYLGGNKVRKNLAILEEFRSSSTTGGIPDVIITNGGAESNHARVVALLGAELGIHVHLVLHGQPESYQTYCGNSFFIKGSDAEVSHVAADAIAETIATSKERYLREGKNVLVIPGGGHCLSGAEAYMNAVDELTDAPDFIVMASGTGATQAGLIAGVRKRGWSTRVLGVSVARSEERGKAAIWEVCAEIEAKYSLGLNQQCVEFFDDYTQGGYAKYDVDSVRRIQQLSCQTGIPFDPVYTGKALLGLEALISSGEIPAGRRVLFWHTGGLLNLQSAQKV